jgi:tetratricopeptide (TPR) repeat protein
MSKYNCDLDYLGLGYDISNEEINEIISEADKIINSNNTDPNTLSTAYLKKAQCLQKLDKFEESRKSIEIALQYSPEIPGALVRLGNVLNLVERKYDVAIEYINKALEHFPEYAYGYTMRGNIYTNKGELNRAISDYNYAITLKPDYTEAFVNRGAAYYLLGKSDNVITDCNEAIRLNPSNANAYVNRGNAYLYKDEFDNAIADYNTATKLEPNHLLSFFNRGVAYANRGEIDKAITNFIKAVQLQPDIIYAINDRGVAYGKEGKYDKAIAIFSAIIQLRPNYHDAINNRGIIFSSINDYENAIADFTRAIQLIPNNAASYFNLGNVYAQIGLYDRAILSFSVGLKIQPADINALFSRATIYANQLDYNKAIADYTEVIRLKPNHAEAFYNRGSIYDRMEEYDKAILDFSQALHFGLNDEETFFSRGAAFAAKGDYDSAIADYERTIQLKPDYVNAFFNIGNVYWNKNEYAKAVESYNKATLLQPNHFGTYFNRGTLYEIKGEYDRALDDYSKALLIIIESKETAIDSINSRNIEAFYYLTDKVLPNSNFFWELPIDKLQNIPHFFIGTILKFRNMGLEKPSYKKLIQSVYSFWQNRKKFDNGIMVYQYTSIKLLGKIQSDRRFHLEPATYQNDPDEGQIFYKRIIEYFKSIDSYIAEVMKLLSKVNSETAVFVRSLTSCKNSLVMWDSSYGDNGCGISVGIPAWKINKGQGIDKTLINYTPPMRPANKWHSSQLIINRNVESEIEEGVLKNTNIMRNEHIDDVVPLWKMGLYKILYLDENDTQEQLKDITDCLLLIEKDEYTEEFKKLLGELFSSVTHLIKDKAYEHEEEYRLLFVDTIQKEKKYIKTSIKDGICEGIYVETEPVLFQDDKDIVYFGPKVPQVTIDKYRHAFRLSGLPFNGSIDNMLLPSGIHYR